MVVAEGGGELEVLGLGLSWSPGVKDPGLAVLAAASPLPCSSFSCSCSRCFPVGLLGLTSNLSEGLLASRPPL